MSPETYNVAVFAPSLLVTVTVESGGDDYDEIHFHMGGQGYWVARGIRELGERPILTAPVGGEPGQVIRGLVASTGLDFSPVQIASPSPGYVHDRRHGERSVLATSRSPDLDRHETDDLYARTLQHSVTAGVCVITGRRTEDRLSVDLYRRLGTDCAAAGVTSVGDFHGDELTAFLEGGPLGLLKVSDEDLASDGLLGDHAADSEVWDAIDRLADSGVQTVVVSRGRDGALGRFGVRRVKAVPPAFEVVDPAGSGDSMTAALAVATVRGLDPEDTLRLACAAGAANVTRHGLGSAPVDLVARVVPLIEIQGQE
jgi:1-phosphofructokinase